MSLWKLSLWNVFGIPVAEHVSLPLAHRLHSQHTLVALSMSCHSTMPPIKHLTVKKEACVRVWLVKQWWHITGAVMKEVGAVLPELKWEPYRLEVYGLNSDPQSRHWVRIEQVSLSRACAVFILPSLSCALRKIYQPIPSVDMQSHHVFSFVLCRSFFYLTETVSVTHFYISASRSFARMALLTSSLWQGGPDLPPPLRWLAALIIIIFCSSDTVTLLSWLLLLSPNFYPWLDVAQKLCHLLYARFLSFYRFPSPSKHVKVFSIPDTSVFFHTLCLFLLRSCLLLNSLALDFRSWLNSNCSTHTLHMCVCLIF